MAHSASRTSTSSRRNVHFSSTIDLRALARNTSASLGLPLANMHFPKAMDVVTSPQYPFSAMVRASSDLFDTRADSAFNASLGG